MLGVPEGSALELDLRLESVVEGVLVSGTVSGTVAGECVRCLDPVSRHLTVDLQELWTHAGREREVRTEEVGEDAEDELPRLQPLCRDDCPGLCSECGVRLADEPGHGHETVDPRWAALQQLADRPDRP